MSINKAQGQSLRHVGHNLSVPVFSHGHLYVALSRSTDINSIIALLNPDAEGRTANVVYREVFERAGGQDIQPLDSAPFPIRR